ncbi:hypothetical protein IWW50_001569 [Coemansia erecta]|nr:hypothetical protein IWW50_001569 [Coemansia erecta]
MFQAQYQYSARNNNARPQSSSRESEQVRFAVADYFDPYQHTPRGQTLNIDAAERTTKPAIPARNAGPNNSSTPPSPVMRAVRHSRPTTPNAPNSSSRDSLVSSGQPQQQQQQQRHYSPPTQFPNTQFPPPTDTYDSAYARTKPRAYTSNESQKAVQPRAFTSNEQLSALQPRAFTSSEPQNAFQPRAFTSNEQLSAFQSRSFTQDESQNVFHSRAAQPLRPRVSSMYADSSVPAAQLHVEVGHAPRVSSAALHSRGSATSELANAAIRDFVDSKATRTPAKPAKTEKPAKQPSTQPWPAVASAAEPQPASAAVSAERSHLIEFIERQRARTMATTASDTRAVAATPALPTTTRDPPRTAARTRANADKPPPDSKGSDTSERSFKRSTARLAEIAPAVQRPAADSAYSRGFKYTSWYAPPTRVSSSPNVDSAQSSPGISPIAELPPSTLASAHLPPPLPSTRVVPRTRAQTVAEESPQDVLFAAHGRIPNKPDSRLARRSNEALPKSYARNSRPTSSSEATLHSRTAAGPETSPQSRAAASETARKSRIIGVQTDAPSTRSRGMQTASNAIHGDEAVLDLMRRMDELRQGHANQISEYQEQVIDMELTNQDLTAEVDQLHAELEAKDAAHKQMASDMRQKLELANKRVDREINEVKAMHAAKCDELTTQITMLLARCSSYKGKLESLGIGEHELLALAATQQQQLQQQQKPLNRDQNLQITDQAFIESQFVETRESSIEADYFKQLMDIERSMENTTIALGFELKRTQAKYLQQAADFIREQMARLQTDRPESRLTLRRSDSRATVGSMKSPVLDAESPDPSAESIARLSGSQSPVRSLAASLSQLAKSQPLPPLPPLGAGSMAKPALRPHQRIVGPEPPAPQQQRLISGSVEPIDEAAEDAVFSGSKPPTMQLQQGSDMRTPAVVRRIPASDALGISQRAATLAAYPDPLQRPATHVPSKPEARGFESEGRTSGLSRMMASTPPKPLASSSAASSHSSAPTDAASDSMSDLFMLSGSPRRSHRSPLAAIASGFFSSSQESMSTAVALSEPTTSMISSSSSGLMMDHVHSLSQPNLTPTKQSKPKTGSFTEHRSLKGSSIGYFTGHCRTNVDSSSADALSWSPQHSQQQSGKSASMHWPPRSDRKPSLSRPQSAILMDSQDMTAEQLLESLKLPPTGTLGITTPTRNNGSFSSSPNGSLGRQSPLPRTGSYSDLCRTFPNAPRFNATEKGDKDVHKMSASVRSYKFDPNAEINIDLGLGPPTVAADKASLGFNSSRRFKRGGQRRRSRSVGAWDRR